MNPLQEKLNSEASVFWNEIAKYLPKSIERSALGDEKIFTAFRLAYPEIRNYLVNLTLEEAKKAVPKEENITEWSGQNNHDSPNYKTGHNDCRQQTLEALDKMKLNKAIE